MKRIIAGVLAAAMLLPGSAVAGAVDAQSKEPPVTSGFRPEQLKQSSLSEITPQEPVSPEEEVTVIVVLEEKTGPLALFQQKNIQNQISKQVLNGEKLQVLHSYTTVENGFAAVVPYGRIEEIQQLPGVAAAYPAPVFQVAPDMPTSMTEVGGLENSSGYQGEGMVIAIVDSGLEISHSCFREAPSSPALQQKDIENVLSTKTLHAEEKKPGVTASQVYHSAKVPFAFDYADNDLDVAPGGAGDHGTHVAGIAAANQGVVADVEGVAPQAQILAMKVFSSSGSNGATWDDILAAADDAVALDADVINMSLGSTCGFSTPEGDEEVAKVFRNIAEQGVLLSISAGNEYSAALGTRIGKGHALTSNPDYGTVASPSSYSEPLSIASVEKADTIESCYFTAGDRKVAFNDTAEDKTAQGVDETSACFRSLAGKTLSYVVVPNMGESRDYEGLDVQGKIALVSRGSVEYNVKKEAAKAAGAAGLVVYNNEPGMLYMQLDQYDLPSAFISQADGQYLTAQAEANRSLTVSSSYGKVDNPTSGEMSDFSSWGVTPELTLKPDITAPGSNIKSTTVNNSYTTKSGTSMSAPFVSGAMAVVKQYVKQKKLAESATDQAALVDALLMSTADLVLAGSDPYSPRKQGAGNVNIAAATGTGAYLTDADGGRPKLALGDDAQKSGIYTMSFQVHSISDQPQTYTLGGYVQTDAQEVTKQLGGKDVHQVTELPYRLEAKVPAQTITVGAGETKTVSVTITLTAADKKYLDENFSNGSFVEGFLTLTPQSETGVVLSLPYMGFYGDWTKAPIVDSGFYWDDLNDQDNWSQAYTNTAGVNSLEGTVNNYLGDNPYHDHIAYLSDRNAISPNGDDYMDALSFVYTGLLRNVRTLKYEIRDASSDEVYYEKTVDYEPKSVYNTNYYQIVPAGAQDYDKITPWYGTTKGGLSLKNNTKAIVTVTGTLSYDKNAGKNERNSWSFPITIDTEEPEAKDITVRSENGKFYVDLTVSDNQYVSNVCISNSSQTKQLASFPVAETTAGASTKCSYDITGFGESLSLIVNDYACNRKVYSVKAEGNADDSEVITPTRPIFTEDFEGTSFPSDGWTLKSTASKTWYQGSEYGSKMAECDLSKTEQQDEWLISSAIDLSRQTSRAGMVFDFYTSYYWSVQNHAHNLQVKASTDGGKTWEDIWQLWDWNQKNEFGPWEKTQAKVSIPDRLQDAEAVQFAFVYQGKNGTSLWLDNIQVYVDDPSSIHTITAKAGEGGSIDPSGSVQISDGKSRTFTITPEDGRFIQDVKVDGESVGTPTSYTFEKVTADHTIEASFGGSGSAGDSELLIDEDFESGSMPQDWTLSKTNAGSYGSWRVSKYYGHYVLQCSADEYDTDDGTGGAGQDERITVPAQDLNGRKTNFTFEFTANKTRLQNGKTVCTLEGSTDGGKTWDVIWDAASCIDQLKTSEFSSYVQTANISLPVPEAMQKDGVLFSFHYVLPKQSTMGSIVLIDNLKLMAEKAQQGGEESVLLDETFDESAGKLPEGWTNTKKNSSSWYNWKIQKSYGQIGASCSADYDSVEDEYGAGQDEFLITPALDLSGKTSGTMTFQFSGLKRALSETVVRGKTTLTLEATDDGGKTWTPVWNAASIADQLKSGVLASNIETADAAVPVPDAFLKSGVQFAFRYQTQSGNTGGCTVFLDNIKLTAAGSDTPTPPAPTSFTITASAGQGGSITPNGAVTVSRGGSQTFTITPSENYELADVTVDGVSVGKQTSYTFDNVTADHRIAASFAEKTVVLPDSIHEDFNKGEMPEGWTVDGLSKYYETWKIGRYAAFDNSGAALCTQNILFKQEQNEKLILPQIRMQDNMQLTFDFGGSYTELSTGSIRLTMQATQNKGQSWTTLWDAKDHLPAVDTDNEPEDITGKGSIAIPAQFCTAETQFAFVFASTDRRDGTAAIDNVVLDASGTPAPNMYGITIAPMQNGTVTADKSIAAEKDIITLTVTPDPGYHLKDGSLMANDVVVSGTTFTMPAKAVTVTALFEKDTAQPDKGSYRDGVYTGSAKGLKGTVTVRVTVKDGKISNIEVTEQQETPSYWENAIAILEKLLGLGDDESISKVDKITGATYSSEAIKAAVLDALKDAQQNDSDIFASGNGSQTSPYLIRTVAQLQAFAASVNDGTDYQGKYVALAANLSLKDAAWTPIGSADHGKLTGFAGTFDGRGFTVSHITCGVSGASVKYEALGFFGVIDAGGMVRNLNLQIDKYSNSDTGGSEMVSTGGLAGILARGAIVEHCSVSGDKLVISEASGPKTAVGGLVGQMQAGSLIANSWSDVGLSYGTLSLNVEAALGGICGVQAQNSLIANSASFGSVPGSILTGRLRVGGLVGQTSGAIYNCYTTSLTKANVMGEYSASGVINNDATTAIGHLVGCSTAGAALYQCYYDKNASQLSNVDLAADPEEGKTERRQATGWDNGSDIKTDKSYITGLPSATLATAAFADTMNEGRKNNLKKAASTYFQAKKLLSDDVGTLEDQLSGGFLTWKLTGERVLFGDTANVTREITDVALQKAFSVAYGTAKEQLDLPQSVEVTLSDSTKTNLSVSWACDSYDASKAGTYTFTGTLALTGGITNPDGKLAYVVVTVLPQEVEARAITAVADPKALSVAYGTAKEQLNLPQSVEVTLSDSSKTNLSVSWACDSYDASKAGTYTFTGTLALTDGITNPDGKTASLSVTVNAKQSGGSGGGGGGSSSPVQKPDITTGSGGSATPSKDGTQITVRPDPGYVIDDVTVNGVSKGAISQVTGLKTGDTVTISFKKAPSFTDVNDHWAKDAIQYVYENGLFAGTSETTFGPNVPMNRAMLVTVLYRLDKEPSAETTSRFKDVPADQWYTKAVAWASANKIVSGYSADTFGPTDTITREQMASILYRYAQVKGYDVSKTTDLAAFTDRNRVSNWAFAPMQWANAEKLINGRTATTLVPQGSATRAEVAQILMMFVQNVVK